MVSNKENYRLCLSHGKRTRGKYREGCAGDITWKQASRSNCAKLELGSWTDSEVSAAIGR